MGNTDENDENKREKRKRWLTHISNDQPILNTKYRGSNQCLSSLDHSISGVGATRVNIMSTRGIIGNNSRRTNAMRGHPVSFASQPINSRKKSEKNKSTFSEFENTHRDAENDQEREGRNIGVAVG